MNQYFINSLSEPADELSKSGRDTLFTMELMRYMQESVAKIFRGSTSHPVIQEGINHALPDENIARLTRDILVTDI